MNFKRLCRICLESLDPNKQSLDIYTKNRLYAEMLSSCTKIKPSEDDGLPRLICKECSKRLKRTYLFIIQCEESDKTLKYFSENPLKSTENDPHVEVKIEDVDDKNNIEELFESDGLLNSPVKNELNDDGNNDTGWNAEDDKPPEGINATDDTGWDAEDDKFLDQLSQKTSEGLFNCEENVTKKERKGRKKIGTSVEDFNDPNRVGERLLPISKRPHQCDICGKVLSTKSNLKAHKACHSDQRPYKCTECPASFKAYSALFQHRRIHTGETPYHCEFCSKRFARRTGLVNHIKVHKGEKQHKCPLCNKCFTQKSQLITHMKRHKGDKSFLCQECGKGFPINAELQVHQRIHNGEKPYACHLCEKKFATSGNLSIHIRIHNKEVRYRCKDCNRGFVTCSAYNVHLKRHKGQRDYICECGKSFYTSSSLKQHKVVHTGEKNYQCKLCNRKFSQGSHLGRHFRRDHAKPGAPLPTSDYYKLVLTSGHRTDIFIEKEQSENVKCEGS
ncbi:zinc finger protein 501-like [Aricia agestis]|uniref:zinc finger protein 501-like n=1 Tax=Aricia agestis TaxID=91739 RepID=UPI001C207907|nr:zinc finger protein 501-like [Aricia agestis]XP_041983005.1 zinc finger protein 501-like [Aricia agestis]